MNAHDSCAERCSHFWGAIFSPLLLTPIVGPGHFLCHRIKSIFGNQTP